MTQLSIRQAAQTTGLTEDTLRYYERRGLLLNVERASSGHRRYSEDELMWIGFVQRLRGTGMSLERIQTYVELWRQGEHTARNEASRQEAERQLQAKGLDVRFLHLDVTDQDTIDRAAQAIGTTFGKLDILVNNAGINSPQDGELSTVTEATLHEVFDTNFFGAFRVTKAVLPLLKKAKAARIVNVSSSLGSLTLASEPGTVEWSTPLLAYNASKSAMNALTVRLAAELHGTAIKVNSANPGYTASNLNNFRGTQSIEEGAVASVRLALLPDDGPSSSFFSKDGSEPW